jgi:hypothetical protein
MCASGDRAIGHGDFDWVLAWLFVIDWRVVGEEMVGGSSVGVGVGGCL